MIKALQKRPLVRPLFFLLTGILVHEYALQNVFVMLMCVGVMVVSLLLFRYRKRQVKYAFRWIDGAIIALLFFLGGYASAALHANNVRWPYSDSQANVTVKLLSIPKEKEKTVACDVQLVQIQRHDSIFTSHKKAILYLNKKADYTSLQIGDQIVINGMVRGLQTGDSIWGGYHTYLQRKGYAATIYAQEIIHSTPALQSWLGLPATWKQHLIRKLQTDTFLGGSWSLPAALLLGDKSGISINERERFSSLGVSHLFAVSGFHIGLIFLVCSLSIGFFLRRQGWRTAYCIISLSIVWLFVVLSGLSYSAVRAGLMLSFYLLSITFFRNYDVFNTLVVCAFLILCIQPQALFDVGFQLSFLSVFFILWLASDLLSFGKNNRVVRYVLSLVTVSCVAQLATLPLTLYYFGIFPLYFLPANLCLIPLVTLLIPLLLVWLLLSFVPGVSWLLSKVIYLLLQAIASLSDAISELPYAIINFTLTEYEVFALYVLMFGCFAILKYKKLRSFLLSKLFVLSLSLRKI